MEIVILDGWQINPGDLSWQPVAQLGTLRAYDDTPQSEMIQRIAGADAIMMNRLSATREVMEGCKNLKYIGMLATGYNAVDLAAANERGITVTNVPGYSTHAVAQHVFALLLQLCNRTAEFSAEVHAGRWQQALGLRFPMVELYGKTLGCIGFGSIGMATAKIARAMGMRVLATGSRPRPEGEALASYVSREELLAKADVVSMHCPLNDATRGMMDAAAFAAMKPGAFFINTARGGLVDEQALQNALQSGHLAGAGVDVVDGEPISSTNPLLSAPRCIITPHIAWIPKETRSRLLNTVADNLRAFQQGEAKNVVNTPISK